MLFLSSTESYPFKHKNYPHFQVLNTKGKSYFCVFKKVFYAKFKHFEKNLWKIFFSKIKQTAISFVFEFYSPNNFATKEDFHLLEQYLILSNTKTPTLSSNQNTEALTKATMKI